MRTHTLLATLVIALSSTAADAAHTGAASVPPDQSLVLTQAAPAIGPAEAARLVGAHSGGRVLDVRTEQRSSGIIYRVKVLLEGGRVRVYVVDGQTGRVAE